MLRRVSAPEDAPLTQKSCVAPDAGGRGHTGAMVMGNRGTYASKRRAWGNAGAAVLDTPSGVGATLNSLRL